MNNKENILTELGLNEINVGACSGCEGWYDNHKTKLLWFYINLHFLTMF